MIKLGLAPGIWIVAISAFFTEIAVVCVVFRMTVIAGMFCFPMLAIFLMTAATVGLLMLALQFIISESMVEIVFVQPDYPGIRSFVVTMTGFTRQVASVLVFTMEALLIAYILGHRFMIVAAKA